MKEIYRVYFEEKGLMRCSVDKKRIKPYSVASGLRTIRVENPSTSLDDVMREILEKDKQISNRADVVAISEFNPDAQFSVKTENGEKAYSVYAYQFYRVMDVGHNHLG
jgi:hypothetical protein